MCVTFIVTLSDRCFHQIHLFCYFYAGTTTITCCIINISLFHLHFQFQHRLHVRQSGRGVRHAQQMAGWVRDDSSEWPTPGSHAFCVQPPETDPEWIFRRWEHKIHFIEVEFYLSLSWLLFTFPHTLLLPPSSSEFFSPHENEWYRRKKKKHSHFER